MPGVGPQYPQIHIDFAEKIATYRAKVGAMLERQTVGHLRSEFLKDIGSAFNPLVHRNGIYFDYAKDLDRLRKSRPPWFAVGWSVEGFRLDPEYWIAANTVTTDEAALMLVGVDPRKVNYVALFEAYSQDDRIDEVLYFIEDLFELLVRKFGDPDESLVSIRLADLCLWVEQDGPGVSYELREIIQRRAVQSADADRKTSLSDENKPLHARTREMFQRALFVAAHNSYGLREKKDSAKVAKKIATAGDFIGFKLDPKKLASHIRAGFSQLDEKMAAEIQKEGTQK
jgi:hypothetical protein